MYIIQRSQAPTDYRYHSADRQFHTLVQMLLALAIACFLPKTFTTESGGWVARSDAAVRPALDYIGRYSPENASSFGLEEYDEKVT